MTAQKTNEHSDDELFRQMKAGDESAFIALYRRWRDGIYRFALRLSGSETAAEDVTQEVFMVLMNDASRYDSGKGSLVAYLYGIARFQALKRMQKDRTMISLDDDDWEFTSDHLTMNADPLLDLSRQEMVKSVRDAILVLPVHYREVVVLCELQELSYADAANVLGCAIGTVRSRLHRARGLLVDKLRPVAEQALART